MGTIADKFVEAFRDYVTDGVPASGPNRPAKTEIRNLGTLIEGALSGALIGAASVVKATRALLNADLAHDVDTTALVYADTTDANNDFYVKVGASGTGSWTLTATLHNLVGSITAEAQAAADSAAADAATVAAVAETMQETVTEVTGNLGDLVAGGQPGSADWVPLFAAPAHTRTINRIEGSFFGGASARKLEFWNRSGSTYNQARADVTINVPSNGLQTLVAPDHFTAFEVPAGALTGFLGTWIGFVSGTTYTAVRRTGVDGDTSFTGSTISNIDFQIRFYGDYEATIDVAERIGALDEAVTYDQENTVISGTSTLATGAHTTGPDGNALWTPVTTLAITAPVNQILIDPKTTGTYIAKLKRSGSQAGDNHTATVTSAVPQWIDIDIPDARAGDEITHTGVKFGYDDAVTGDQVTTHEGGSLGFRFGYRQTATVQVPLKDKVAAIAVGGSDLPQAASCYGNSLTHYDQDVPNSFPSKLQTLLGIPVNNFGVSGQTPEEIEPRFNAAPATWNDIIIFEAYNGFSDIDAYMAPIVRMVAKMGPAHRRRFLILSCLTGDSTGLGGSTYINQILELNACLQAQWPDNYVDWRTHLMKNALRYNNMTPTSDDLADIAGGFTPRSIRIPGDYLHLTGLGYAPAAQLLSDIIISRHWIN